MRILLYALICFPLSFFSQKKAKVVGISDGDTITVLLDGNIQQKLRLAEVDCPENRQPFGKNAKKFTSDKVFGKQITFTETNKDRYGRSVAKVYYDKGKYLSAEIIKAGYGWSGGIIPILRISLLGKCRIRQKSRSWAYGRTKKRFHHGIFVRSSGKMLKRNALKSSCSNKWPFNIIHF